MTHWYIPSKLKDTLIGTDNHDSGIALNESLDFGSKQHRPYFGLLLRLTDQITQKAVSFEALQSKRNSAAIWKWWTALPLRLYDSKDPLDGAWSKCSREGCSVEPLIGYCRWLTPQALEFWIKAMCPLQITTILLRNNFHLATGLYIWLWITKITIIACCISRQYNAGYVGWNSVNNCRWYVWDQAPVDLEMIQCWVCWMKFCYQL